MLRAVLLGAATLIGLMVLGMAFRSALAARPQRFDTAMREITPCQAAQNCVSSHSTDDLHRVDPLRFAGSPEAAFQTLRNLVEGLPRTRIVTAEDTYLHAQCTSRIFRFVDDLELLLDREAGVVHVRSASRIGFSDLGVNRRRVENLRARFSE
jgi:uncharacterized protein (DUF1499 family)